MSVLKWQRGSSEWVTLYGTVLKNRLRRDKNLADLGNATEAKKNLGLIGDVVDHHHDSRYLPRLARIEDKIDREISDRQSTEQNFYDELRTRIQSEVNASIESFGVSVRKEASDRKDADEQLRLEIGNEATERDKKIQEEADKRSKDKAELIDKIQKEKDARIEAIRVEAANRDAAVADAKDLVPAEAKLRKEADEKEIDERNRAIELKAQEVRSQINAESMNRDAAIAKAKADITVLVNNEAAERTQDVNVLHGRCFDLEDTIESNRQEIYSHVENVLGRYTVGTVAPSDPVNNQSIWFYTGDGEESIRIYKNNRWVTFGSSYL